MAILSCCHTWCRRYSPSPSRRHMTMTSLHSIWTIDTIRHITNSGTFLVLRSNAFFSYVGHFQSVLKILLACKFILNSYVNMKLNWILFELWHNLQFYVQTQNTKMQRATADTMTDDNNNLLPDLHYDSPICLIQRRPYLPICLFLKI